MARKKRRFANEDEERAYWAEHDSTGSVDWSKAKRLALPNLHPSVKSISLRLPVSMLEEIKRLAHKQDVPYQSLIKVFLAERIREEVQEGAST